VTTIPTDIGRSILNTPKVIGTTYTAFDAATAPVVAQSFTDPTVDPTTNTLTLATRPGTALMTVATVMFLTADVPLPVIKTLFLIGRYVCGMIIFSCVFMLLSDYITVKLQNADSINFLALSLIVV
jgi:hypothetical protein